MALLIAAALTSVNPSQTTLERMEGDAAVAHMKNKAPTGTGEVLVITPLERANDIKHVFAFTEKNKSLNLELVLNSGKVISQLIDVQVMPGGTILLVKSGTMKGDQYIVVRTEAIEDIKLQ